MKTSKKNNFLQRITRKANKQQNVESIDDSRGHRNVAKEDSSPKSLMKRLGNPFLCNNERSFSLMGINKMRSADSNVFREIHAGSLWKRNSSATYNTPPEMSELARIIHEFEMDFKSPTKHQKTVPESLKQRNFVKKIVAAFEVKFKPSNEGKNDQRSAGASRHNDSDSIESAQSNSEIFTKYSINPKKIIYSTRAKSADDLRRSGVFSPLPRNDRCYFNFGEDIDTSSIPPNHHNEGRVSNLETSTPSSVKKNSPKREIYATPINVSRRSIKSEKISDSSESYCCLDDTKIPSTSDFDQTLPILEKTSSESSNLIEKTQSTKTFERNLAKLDKTPKIVGAFLKKPVKIEETSINWIPINDKKLPRKKSLKKLFVNQKKKKSLEINSKTLSASQGNINEEPKEFQDSGYEEKSCSTSSLKSTLSVEATLRQESAKMKHVQNTKIILKTFKPKKILDETTANKDGKPKLLLSEVPREKLKLDLGPCYPTAADILTMSLSRKASIAKEKMPIFQEPNFPPLKKIPKHPFLSSIPKHPFVSITKMENLEEPEQLFPLISRCACNSKLFCSYDSFSVSPSISSSPGSHYDIPRQYMIKSEAAIIEMYGQNKQRKEDPIYDVPRPILLDRPRSSTLEDAISLKRRNACFSSNIDVYSSSAASEPHYATVKPRIHRAFLSDDMLYYRNEFGLLDVQSLSI